ncbi:MAG: YfiH family protein [Glaciecola sp.]
MSALTFIQPTWPVNKRVFCASTTIDGGVSNGVFNSLNLGAHVGDDAFCVETNRQLLAYELKSHVPNIQPISWLHQTHSTNVLRVTEPTIAGEVHADAAFSQTPDLPCNVMTADCMALMMSNSDGTEVAAVHAGWKGLINGVIENTVAQFSSPHHDIHVWFAPSISQQHFEVGFDVADLFSQFPSALKASSVYNKVLLDLLAVASLKLDALGISQRYYSNICTYSATNLFSHRRATHQGLLTCGRMTNLILIKDLDN